jgi:hypothetical protein
MNVPGIVHFWSNVGSGAAASGAVSSFCSWSPYRARKASSPDELDSDSLPYLDRNSSSVGIIEV